MKLKLSPQQFRLLCDIREQPKHVVDYYPPAKKLIELGLAERPRPDKLAITEKGRKLIDAGGPT